MPSPFPGSDPYLEAPRYWSDFHDSFITYAREQLQAQLPVQYRARISEWLVLEANQRVMIPDVSVVRRPLSVRPAGGTAATLNADDPVVVTALAEDLEQSTIDIIDRAGESIVTAIELLSPINKARGEGRARYLDKQQNMLRGGASLVDAHDLADVFHAPLGLLLQSDRRLLLALIQPQRLGHPNSVQLAGLARSVSQLGSRLSATFRSPFESSTCPEVRNVWRGDGEPWLDEGQRHSRLPID